MKTKIELLFTFFAFLAFSAPASAYITTPVETVAIYVNLIQGDDILFYVGAERPLRLNERYEVVFGGKKWGEIIVAEIYDTVTKGRILKGSLTVLQNQVVLLNRILVYPEAAYPYAPGNEIKTRGPSKIVEPGDWHEYPGKYVDPYKIVKLPPIDAVQPGESGKKSKAVKKEKEESPRRKAAKKEAAAGSGAEDKKNTAPKKTEEKKAETKSGAASPDSGSADGERTKPARQRRRSSATSEE